MGPLFLSCSLSLFLLPCPYAMMKTLPLLPPFLKGDSGGFVIKGSNA
jgi:hypothetical protein